MKQLKIALQLFTILLCLAVLTTQTWSGDWCEKQWKERAHHQLKAQEKANDALTQVVGVLLGISYFDYVDGPHHYTVTYNLALSRKTDKFIQSLREKMDEYMKKSYGVEAKK